MSDNSCICAKNKAFNFAINKIVGTLHNIWGHLKIKNPKKQLLIIYFKSIAQMISSITPLINHKIVIKKCYDSETTNKAFSITIKFSNGDEEYSFLMSTPTAGNIDHNLYNMNKSGKHIYSCFHCERQSEKRFKKCSKCRFVSYCSIDCQSCDWDDHKTYCGLK